MYDHQPKKIIRLHQVVEQTSLSKSTIYKFIQDGKFPKQFNLGPRAAGWLQSDIDEWIEEKRRA